MRIESFLHESARQSGGKLALVTSERRLTYAELDDLSDRVAHALASHGVARGDRVVILMENCWEAVVSIFGVLKAGAVFSPVNPSTKVEKLTSILNNCRARAVLTQARFASGSADAIDNAQHAVLLVATGEAGIIPPQAQPFEVFLVADQAGPVYHSGIDLDLAMLIYTSGTTGQPKGVMMCHRSMEAVATSITTYLQNRSEDIILNVLPITFGYGLYQIITAVKVGATLILEKSFAFPAAILQLMRKEGVTGFPLVPTMAAIILQMKESPMGDLPGLRYITTAAAPLPPTHLDGLRQLFPAARLYSMYGQTECQRCTWLPPEELDRRPGSVGIAIPNTEVFILDENGERVAPGVVGELVVRGPHVMQGYWEDKASTDKALRTGPNPWENVLYTGDLFRSDADGFLYFVSRKDDIIKTRGEKVAPKEVEAVLHACPGIIEAVVVGVPDPILGQAVQAIVVRANDNLSERQIIRHCAAHLEDFMVPTSIVFRPDIPKTDTGKISRRLAVQALEAAG